MYQWSSGPGSTGSLRLLPLTTGSFPVRSGVLDLGGGSGRIGVPPPLCQGNTRSGSVGSSLRLWRGASSRGSSGSVPCTRPLDPYTPHTFPSTDPDYGAGPGRPRYSSTSMTPGPRQPKTPVHVPRPGPPFRALDSRMKGRSPLPGRSLQALRVSREGLGCSPLTSKHRSGVSPRYDDPRQVPCTSDGPWVPFLTRRTPGESWRGGSWSSRRSPVRHGHTAHVRSRSRSRVSSRSKEAGCE